MSKEPRNNHVDRQAISEIQRRIKLKVSRGQYDLSQECLKELQIRSRSRVEVQKNLANSSSQATMQKRLTLRLTQEKMTFQEDQRAAKILGVQNLRELPSPYQQKAIIVPSTSKRMLDDVTHQKKSMMGTPDMRQLFSTLNRQNQNHLMSPMKSHNQLKHSGSLLSPSQMLSGILGNKGIQLSKLTIKQDLLPPTTSKIKALQEAFELGPLLHMPPL